MQILMYDSRFKISAPHCPLCQSAYDMYYHVPLVLPKCGHTFCQKCIQNKIQSKGNRKVFICSQCNVDVVIRKGVNEELPRNISIIDVVKNLKKTVSQEEPQSPARQCTEHQKPLEVVCLTCKNIRICSHCAIFGIHKGHQISNKIPISKSQLADLKEYFSIITQAVKLMLLPSSEENVLLKSKKTLSEGLQKTIKLTFQYYYDQIAKKQEQLLRECERIQVHGDIGKSIDSALEEYDIYKMRCEVCDLTSDSKIIDELFESGKNIHTEIEAIKRQTEKITSQFLNQSAKLISQTVFFRVNEINSKTLKEILNKNQEENKKYSETNSRINSSRVSDIKSRFSEDAQILDTEDFIKEPVKKEKSKKKEECKIIRPPSGKYSQVQSKVKQSSSIAKNEKNQEKEKRNKSRTSHFKDYQDQQTPNNIDLKFVKPIKQINYELRPKLQNILNQIDRQEVGGTLQLINTNISEFLMPYICQHLRSKRLKFSMMKLVKDSITDEGMRVLLCYLMNDNFTKVLNLTGNQLSHKSLDMLDIFIKNNQILKTIYLSNNKISSFQFKSRKKAFDEHYMEVII